MNFEPISSGLSQGSQQNDVLTTGHRSYWSCAHPHVTWHKPDVQGSDLGFTLKQQVLDCWCKVCFICPCFLWRIHRKSWSQRAKNREMFHQSIGVSVVGTKSVVGAMTSHGRPQRFFMAGSGGGFNHAIGSTQTCFMTWSISKPSGVHLQDLLWWGKQNWFGAWDSSIFGPS